MQPEERIPYLLKAFTEKTATDTEEQELYEWVNGSEDQTPLVEHIREIIEQYKKEEAPEVDWEGMYRKITAKLQMGKVRRMTPVRWIAAASVILVLALATYLLLNRRATTRELAEQPLEIRFKNDISPATQEAILTLADGSTVVLDHAANGTLATQGNAKVIKEDGMISYDAGGATEVVYNTVSTRKGKVFQLRLADGTLVWLDAESSIRYPAAFQGSERVVEVTGQVYFEVAPSGSPGGKAPSSSPGGGGKAPSSSPGGGGKSTFIVRNGDMEVTVLGTHFNVNAYDEGGIKVTLLEGSVRVSNSGKAVTIKPGEQAQLIQNRTISIQHDPDLDEVMAWKNGRFQFNGSSMEEIMTQLSRWYHIEVEYKDRITESFVAKISRDMPVSRLLQLLEMTKQVKFIIEGNRVTVLKWQ